MNEKTEKDGTGKLQSSAGIAKTEGSTAATCASFFNPACLDKIATYCSIASR